MQVPGGQEQFLQTIIKKRCEETVEPHGWDSSTCGKHRTTTWEVTYPVLSEAAYVSQLPGSAEHWSQVGKKRGRAEGADTGASMAAGTSAAKVWKQKTGLALYVQTTRDTQGGPPWNAAAAVASPLDAAAVAAAAVAATLQTAGPGAPPATAAPLLGELMEVITTAPDETTPGTAARVAAGGSAAATPAGATPATPAGASAAPAGAATRPVALTPHPLPVDPAAAGLRAATPTRHTAQFGVARHIIANAPDLPDPVGDFRRGLLEPLLQLHDPLKQMKLLGDWRDGDPWQMSLVHLLATPHDTVKVWIGKAALVAGVGWCWRRGGYDLLAFSRSSGL